MRAILLLAALALPACASQKAARAQHREVMDALVAQREALAELRHALAGLESEQLALRARQDEMVREVSEERSPAVQDERMTGLEQRLDAIQASIDDLRTAKPTTAVDPPKPGRPDPAAVYRMTIDGAHARGPATAKVTVVACSDFQCPFCARVVPTLEELADIYGDELRIVYKHNPLPMHNRALPAAIAAEAAGKQGKFWGMHDKLFANARELTDANFSVWARELGLDVAKFERDVADPKMNERVQSQQKQCNTLGARGTPSFFVNGRFLSGAQPLESFRVLIDEEAKKADAQLKKGTSRKKLYDTIVKGGRKSV